MADSYKIKFNPLWLTGLQYVLDSASVTGISFKEGVDTASSLPSSGNSVNDVRIASDTHHIYVWNGSSWTDQGDFFNVDWTAITNKPSSSVVDIDDAVTKKHTQGTDQGLDTGGANEVTAAQAKTAYTKSHDQNTDTGTTGTTFQIDSGNSGPKLKNSSGELQARNSADDDYAPLGVKVIKIPDATAQAFIIQEGANTYITFDTTDGAERILVSKDLEIESIEIEEDAGAYTIVNLPISTTPVSGTEESYSFKIDGSLVLKIYGEADGSGGVQNIRLVLENGASIANKQNIDIDTGTETVDSFATSIGDAVIFDFVVKNGVNLRAGQIYACWDSSNNVEYTEVSTNDLGDTSGLALAVDIDSGSVRLRATAGTDNWAVKVIRRVL